MSAWTDQVLPASFRGVLFQIDTYNQDGSVRGDVYELESTVKGKVLGTGARRHRIEGFLNGDDAVAQWRSLQGALEQGSGVLVHPLLGERTVQIGNFGVQGTRAIHGRLTFAFDCVEIDPTPYVPVVDEELGITIAAEAARASLLADFLAAYSVAGDLADSVLDEAEAFTGELLDRVASGLAVVADARAAVARIAEIKADLRSLLDAPGDFFDALLGLFADIADLFGASGAATGLPAAPELAESYGTASEEQADVNAVAIQQAIAGCAIVRAVEIVPGWTFASWDLAVGFGSTFGESIQAQEEVSTPDTAAALADLRVALDAAIEALAGDLVPLRDVFVAEPEPAIITAYRLYGDPDRASEIVTRNDLADPGAVSGSLRVATL